MSDDDTNAEDTERAALLAKIDRLQGELRSKLLTLIEHPGSPEEFKNNSVVKDWVKCTEMNKG